MRDGVAGAAVLDMTDLTDAGGEQGPARPRVPPDDGPLAYVNYTNNDGDTVIAEYAVGRRRRRSTRRPRREVLAIDQPYANHNGGDVVFGPDGMLYIGMGDGGSADDPDRDARSTSASCSARCCASTRTPSGDAAVHRARRQPVRRRRRRPARDLVDRAAQPVAVQLRPRRRATCGSPTSARTSGRRSTSPGPPMAAAGASNFGWSAWEGTHRFNDDQPADGVTPPIFEYEHGDAGCSVSGGVRLPRYGDSVRSSAGTCSPTTAAGRCARCRSSIAHSSSSCSSAVPTTSRGQRRPRRRAVRRCRSTAPCWSRDARLTQATRSSFAVRDSRSVDTSCTRSVVAGLDVSALTRATTRQVAQLDRGRHDRRRRSPRAERLACVCVLQQRDLGEVDHGALDLARRRRRHAPSPPATSAKASATSSGTRLAVGHGQRRHHHVAIGQPTQRRRRVRVRGSHRRVPRHDAAANGT